MTLALAQGVLKKESSVTWCVKLITGSANSVWHDLNPISEIFVKTTIFQFTLSNGIVILKFSYDHAITGHQTENCGMVACSTQVVRYSRSKLKPVLCLDWVCGSD